MKMFYISTYYYKTGNRDLDKILCVVKTVTHRNIKFDDLSNKRMLSEDWLTPLIGDVIPPPPSKLPPHHQTN